MIRKIYEPPDPVSDAQHNIMDKAANRLDRVADYASHASFRISHPKVFTLRRYVLDSSVNIPVMSGLLVYDKWTIPEHRVIGKIPAA